MASLIRYDDGLYRVAFGPADARKVIRLGRMTARAARSFKSRIEALLSDRAAGRLPDEDLAAWLRNLDEPMLAKLRRHGLADGVGAADTTLGDFLTAYIDSRTDAKPSTITTYRRAEKKLLAYFGAGRRLREITPGDADEFARWLRTPAGGDLALATARKTVQIAKQFMTAAARKRLVSQNAFADLSGSVPANRDRDYYVTREIAQKVLNACPDAEWRLLFALSRFGGLRCPSEVLALTWADVDFGTGRMVVRSPKTEHHHGKGSRVVPIFPELFTHLRDAFEHAEPGTVHCITRYRDSTANLRTQLNRIIGRAGLTPWPKLWQNMRATRETELAEEFPAHVVSDWIGNSVVVAQRHYLQVTDEHFARAAGIGDDGEAHQKAHQTVIDGHEPDLSDDETEGAQPVGASEPINGDQSSSNHVETQYWATRDQNAPRIPREKPQVSESGAPKGAPSDDATPSAGAEPAALAGGALAEAIAAIGRLPLDDAEKAEAVRRLLAGER